jgi:hypothetical protein
MAKETQVVINFAEHEQTQAIKTDSIMSKAVAHLSLSPNNRVIYFIESAGTSSLAAHTVMTLSERGVLPSSALKCGIYFDSTGTIPSPEAVSNLQFGSKFTDSQARFADSMSLSYWGRFRLVTEFEPKEYVGAIRDSEGRQVIDKYYVSAVTEALKGNFGDASKYLKDWMGYVYKTQLARNARIYEQIRQLASDERNLVIVSLGTAHSPVWHLLKAGGINVEAIFEDKTDGSLYYSPFEVLSRKYISNTEEPSDFDYHKTLCLAVISQVIRWNGESEGKPISRVNASKLTFKLGVKLTNLDSIRQFEEMVRQVGPTNAVNTLTA